MIKIETIYSSAISVRNLEIEYFWQRNIFLFGIQGVILSFFVGSFDTLIKSSYSAILGVTALFGLFFAIFSFFILYVSKLWVDYWEEKCHQFEEKYELEFQLFDKHQTKKDKDKKDKNEKTEPIFPGYISTKLLVVSSSMLFVIFWTVALVYLYMVLY